MENCRARIEEVNSALNCFCFVFRDEAMALAKEAETAILRGDDGGPLHGLPVAIKDFTPTKGKRATRGSKAFENWIPDRNALIVDRLCGAGAIMGGPVRIPASFRGIVGLKPCLGRIPLDTLPTVFDNISHFGPLTRTIGDAALFMSAASGPREQDIMSVKETVDFDASLPTSVEGKRFALSLDLGFLAVDGEVEAQVRAAAAVLADAGAKVEEVDMGWTRQFMDCRYDYWGVYLGPGLID